MDWELSWESARALGICGKRGKGVAPLVAESSARPSTFGASLAHAVAIVLQLQRARMRRGAGITGTKRLAMQHNGQHEQHERMGVNCCLGGGGGGSGMKRRGPYVVRRQGRRRRRWGNGAGRYAAARSDGVGAERPGVWHLASCSKAGWAGRLAGWEHCTLGGGRVGFSGSTSHRCAHCTAGEPFSRQSEPAVGRGPRPKGLGADLVFLAVFRDSNHIWRRCTWWLSALSSDGLPLLSYSADADSPPTGASSQWPRCRQIGAARKLVQWAGGHHQGTANRAQRLQQAPLVAGGWWTAIATLRLP